MPDVARLAVLWTSTSPSTISAYSAVASRMTTSADSPPGQAIRYRVWRSPHGGPAHGDKMVPGGAFKVWCFRRVGCIEATGNHHGEGVGHRGLLDQAKRSGDACPIETEVHVSRSRGLKVHRRAAGRRGIRKNESRCGGDIESLFYAVCLLFNHLSSSIHMYRGMSSACEADCSPLFIRRSRS